MYPQAKSRMFYYYERRLKNIKNNKEDSFLP